MKKTERITVPDLYQLLSRLYSCKYADSKEEREEAIRYLENEYRDLTEEDRSAKTHLLTVKMRELRLSTDEYQSKLCSHIMGRFWEKEFILPLKVKSYRIDDDE